MVRSDVVTITNRHVYFVLLTLSLGVIQSKLLLNKVGRALNHKIDWTLSRTLVTRARIRVLQILM